MICERSNKFNKTRCFFLIIFLCLNTSLSIKSFKKVILRDLKISGSELITPEDIVKNSSLDLPRSLILIKTKFLEKELKKNLSLENISINRQIMPFGLSILIKTKKPIAYGERKLDGGKIFGLIDENGFFIKDEYIDKKDKEELRITVFGWQEKFRKTLLEILNSQKIDQIELVAIRFSENGFLTLEEEDLKTIFLGFNQNLIEFQLQIITNLKNQLKKSNFSEKIDIIDLTDPGKPKIKVFKP